MKYRKITRGKIKLFATSLIGSSLFFSFVSCDEKKINKVERYEPVINKDTIWHGPDTNNIPGNEFGELVKYGRNLILNVAYYLGPNGVAGKFLGNKMNCTNCHLEAGTKPYAFNF